MSNLIFTRKITAALSFIIGTVLLSLFFYFRESEFIIQAGLIFTFSALIINSLLFLMIIISAGFNNKYRTELLKISGIMLINIPIAIGYLFLVIHTVFPSKG